jgi:hypothetical protein
MMSALWSHTYNSGEITNPFLNRGGVEHHRIYTISIKDRQGLIFFKIIIFDKNLAFWNAYSDRISFNNFTADTLYSEFSKLKKVLEKCLIFSASIEAQGISKIEKDVSCLISNLPIEVPIKQYCCFRNPADRILSLYNYIKSPLSSHENTHNAFQSETFKDFVMNECKDNWLVRQLANFQDEKIKAKNFDKALEILKSFEVYKFESIERLTKKCLYECHNINRNRIQNNFTIFNKKNPSANKVVENDAETQNKLKDLTYFDSKLLDLTHTLSL